MFFHIVLSLSVAVSLRHYIIHIIQKGNNNIIDMKMMNTKYTIYGIYSGVGVWSQ
jgi:hypothetical protein